MIKIKPTLEELRKIEGDYGYYPVYAEVFADIKTPIQTLRTLKAAGGKCFLFESVEGGEKWSRYSFIGFRPILEVMLQEKELTVIEGDRKKTVSDIDFADFLKALLHKYRSPRLPNLAPMTGGFAGYFSYDYGAASSGVCLKGASGDGCFDAHLMLFDKIIAYDHFRQKIAVIVNISGDCLEQSYLRAQREIQRLIELITSPPPKERFTLQLTGEFKSYPDKKEFTEWIAAIKRHITEGDVFQAVPSVTQEVAAKGSLVDCYRRLRTSNPSPYMFYMDSGDSEICGASPETLIKKEGELLSTFPIAGSAARGKTQEEDEENAKRLLADEKELSEHNMLVDLGRNDISKVSRFGTVKVRDYRKILRFSHIMHITTTVTGLQDERADVLDDVQAMLPAGTLSGAPKKRAMEIIAALEGKKRGFYGGAAGYIDLTGNMDVCIGIRAAVKSGDKVTVRSGCGVVADSDAQKEYIECMNKARAVINALTGKED